MKTFKKSLLATSVTLASLAMAPATQAEGFIDGVTKAMVSGTASGDLNARYEMVSDDSDAKDADALTVRARLTYKTGSYEGFSGVIGFEHTKALVDDYAPESAGYSVVADPEVTELDQGYLQYKKGGFTIKGGEHVLTFDGHRHVGHVGWRQDRQTFTGVSASYAVSDDFKINYSYINQVNGILSKFDADTDDHLVNISYNTGLGKLVGYSYMLESDATGDTRDTYGLSFNGAKKLDSFKLIYGAEFATQTFETGTSEFDTEYLSLTAGAAVSGITFKANYEVLGSDSGDNAFQTPYATKHKFNGWTDQFLGTPATGLVDMNFTVSTKVLGGKALAAYHIYESDEGSIDYGDELNLLFAKKLNKTYSAGIKYAMYSADDYKVDTDKLWIWLNAKF